MNLKLALKVFSKGVVKNLPTILGCVAVGGLFGSVTTAIIDTPKAIKKIDEAKMDKAEKLERELNEDALDIYKDDTGAFMLSKIKLTPWEYITILVPTYWKTGVCVLLTTGCILGANHINQNRIAMLLAALKLKEKELKEQEDKIKELFGDKKHEELRTEIAKDHLLSVPNEDEVSQTGCGDALFYEPILQRYFRSSLSSVKNGWVMFKDQMRDNDEATLTDLYYFWSIPLKDHWYTDQVQWTLYDSNSPDGYGMRKHSYPSIDFIWSTYERTGEHCAEIRYDRMPDIG